MRKYLLPAALILALGLGYAAAQNITKALQLSQDPLGAFGVDTNNNVYFPKHVLNTQTAPTVSGCGTGATVTGTDTAGTVTMGTSATGCLVTFNAAFLAAPACSVSWRNTANASQATYTTTLTTISTTQGTISNNVLDYVCMSTK